MSSASRSRFEFIALIASLTALDALAIDSMLPALRQISTDLMIAHDNDRQYIVTMIFFGFAIGLPIYGFLGDGLGRRRPIVAGIAMYLMGTLVCGFAESLPLLLVGRVLQGIGAAGPYVLSLAIVRDTYEGREMAQAVSLVMMIFMAVPALAPIIGQAILLIGGWRHIFLVLAVFAVVTLVWFVARQPETLPLAQRMPLSTKRMLVAAKTVFTHPEVMPLAIAQGLVMGAFIAFLSTSQQILQQQFRLGTQFPLYFALLSVTLGVAAYFNSNWVMRFGMYRLVIGALMIVLVTSVLFGIGHSLFAKRLGLWGFMVYMMVIYACCGLLFGNLSSMAMSPMGKVAGVASSLIGSSSIVVAFGAGALIGSQYESSVLPIIIGFAVCAALSSLLVFRSADKQCVQNG